MSYNNIEFYRSKRKLIENFLNNNMEIKTNTVVRKIKNIYNIKVSPRSVQRIRKEMKEKMKGKINMENNDVFDTNSSSTNNLNKLLDDQIDLVNLINEGGWSIQQLAEATPYTVQGIRYLLKNTLKDYIKSEVLDEENEGVYVNHPQSIAGQEVYVNHPVSTGQQTVLDDLDKLDLGFDNSPPNINSEPVESGYWEIEQECVTACSKVEKEFKVYIGHFAKHKAMCYMKWAGAREWLAYLIGKFDNKKYIITDLFLPNQATSAALVNKIEAEDYNKMNIIGVIHSHHEMGAGDENKPSFSGHDEMFINSNHNLSLLAGRDRTTNGFKIVGLARTKTPCGAFIKVKAKVLYLAENPSRDKELKKEFLEKTQSNNNTGFYYNGNYKYGIYGKNVNYNNGVSSNVKVNDKRTFTPGPDGVVQTRGNGFHFKN